MARVENNIHHAWMMATVCAVVLVLLQYDSGPRIFGPMWGATRICQTRTAKTLRLRVGWS